MRYITSLIWHLDLSSNGGFPPIEVYFVDKMMHYFQANELYPCVFLVCFCFVYYIVLNVIVQYISYVYMNNIYIYCIYIYIYIYTTSCTFLCTFAFMDLDNLQRSHCDATGTSMVSRTVGRLGQLSPNHLFFQVDEVWYPLVNEHNYGKIHHF